VNIAQILDRDKTKQLFHAKSKYGQLFVFKSPRFLVIFRPLTVDETEVLSTLSDSLDICAVEEWVFSTAFVTGSHSVDYFLDKGPYLIVSELSARLPILSSIQEEDDYKKKILNLRAQSNKVQDLIESIICKAFSSYKVKDVKELSQSKVLDLLVKAETASGEMLDLRDQAKNKKKLRNFRPDTNIIGGTEHITSPLVADVPNFDEDHP
jgi:hypothetical protein